MRPTLYIGNKNYSSWSMRPWLALRWAGIDFEEVTIPLGGVGYGKSRIPAVRAVSPSGRVPALRIGDTVIYDSLGIAEWVVEQAPGLYPDDPLDRALCRSAVAEMHSGFAALRRDLSMNIRRRVGPRAWPWPDDVRSDIDRVFEAWTHWRTRYGGAGPYLFGARTLADAFYAPVCTRFRTYGVQMPPVVATYCQTIFADPDVAGWESGAAAEPWSIPETDALYA